MKRFIYSVLFVILSLSVCADTLKDSFQNPPNSAKPRTWWHWVSGNVSKAGITADLEAMHRVGLQEAQIFTVTLGYPRGDVFYQTDKWYDMFHFALSEANRLGMNMAFHNCAGWSSSGGPWVTPENSMKKVSYSDTTISGGKLVRILLKQPKELYNYYKDIVVWAFPTPKGKVRIDDLGYKSLASDPRPYLEPDLKTIEPQSVVRQSDLVDLTSKMSADGKLVWKAPAGEWTILRIGYTTTGDQNDPVYSTAMGMGLEVDKLSSKALDQYWKDGIQPILDKMGPLAGTTLNNILVDSYERGSSNWTQSLEQEFRHRRHYGLLCWLPTLAGYYMESGPETERFLWDFRKTLGELMNENYFGHFGELCHLHGINFSTEPYGGPFDQLAAGVASDIPMTEFWAEQNIGDVHPEVSAAHLKGNTVVGAEAFTANDDQSRYLNYPGTMKPLGDYAWASGVNLFIFHTFAHQPWNVAPGLLLCQFGSEINRLNTWWEQSKAYMQYVTRSQFMLQQGKNIVDVLQFQGESTFNSGCNLDIKSSGYDYDLIDATNLAKVTVENGLIKTPAGYSYRMLKLSRNEPMMTPQLLEQLKRLTDAGAKIFGPKPEHSPSLQDFPKCDLDVKALADELWDKGTIQDISVTQALKKLNVIPDFYVPHSMYNLSFNHRATESEDIYFISNGQNVFSKDTCYFRVDGSIPELWDAETGRTKPLLHWNTDNGRTVIPLEFLPYQSYFIVFRKGITAKNPHLVKIEEQQLQKNLPLKGLKIEKAFYSNPFPPYLNDVTDIMAEHWNTDKIQIQVSEELFGSNPLPGTSSELRISYTANGKPSQISVAGGQMLRLPQTGESGPLHLEGAVYGHVIKACGDWYPHLVVEVTDRVKSLVDAGQYIFAVDKALVGDNFSDERILHLNYSSEEDIHKLRASNKRVIDLTRHEGSSQLSYENNHLTWITPKSGQATVTDAANKSYEAKIRKIPETYTLDGPWSVTFPFAEKKLATTFPKLTSWIENTNDSIKYFSGTVTYQKEINLPKPYFRKDVSLELDLGKVCVIAEVRVNGQDLGILWHAPYRLELGSALKAGKNQLEIRITNLWANRLIGDEQYSEDVKRRGPIVAEWPTWLNDPSQRRSKRTTFCAYQKWKKGEPLQPSGLLGPVLIRPYIHKLMKGEK